MEDATPDARRYAPATLRNRDAILDVLRRCLPERGLVLEVASGSGEHVVHFATALPRLTFQPSDPDPEALASIDVWAAISGVANVRQALALDASVAEWPVGKADAVVCINMVHIAPWAATPGLLRGAARVLPQGGPLYLYATASWSCTRSRPRGSGECSRASWSSGPARPLAKVLREEGATGKSGQLLDKGDVYKLLANRTYAGEATHKGRSYPGEHEAIISRALWEEVQAVLGENARTRSNANRNQSPALLRGLIFGTDGRALSPTHTRRRGRLYRYYVAQRVLKGDAPADDSIVRRVPAAEIEAAVVDQVRALLRQPEVVVGTWLAARAEAPELTEEHVRDALGNREPLWGELFPAEQARIVRLLVERVVVGPAGADIRLRVEGLAGLVRDLGANRPVVLEAA